jgi:hypothetical protein
MGCYLNRQVRRPQSREKEGGGGEEDDDDNDDDDDDDDDNDDDDDDDEDDDNDDDDDGDGDSEDEEDDDGGDSGSPAAWAISAVVSKRPRGDDMRMRKFFHLFFPHFSLWRWCGVFFASIFCFWGGGGWKGRRGGGGGVHNSSVDPDISSFRFRKNIK